MKKLSILIFVALILSACAAGINHSVALVNNRPYLIETKTRNFLGLEQWSEEYKYIDIEREVQKQAAKEDFLNSCVSEATKKNPNLTNYQYVKEKTRCEKLFESH